MRIGIVGPGRAGCGLGLALREAGHDVRVHGRRRKDVPPPLSSAYTFGGVPPWVSDVEVVLLAVQDRAIQDAAEQLADSGSLGADHVVLHLSGILGEAPLAPLSASGAARGTMHPLQAIAAPEVAPARLKGALAAITGDRRAADVATTLAASMGMLPVPIDADVKAKYHAAAVIASNYLVVLAAVAEQLMKECGFEEGTARRGLAALMSGTLANVAAVGPVAALTGPVVRGDDETVRKNIDALSEDAAELYRMLAHVALALKAGPVEPRDDR